MRLSIFSRLVMGYLALLVLATVVSVYAIVELGQVKDITHSILVDNSVIDRHKDMTDAFLSEARYEKKFVIMQDNSFYESFLKSKGDFEQYFNETMLLADSAEVRGALAKAAALHNTYQKLFNEEAESLKTGRKYSKAWYDREKERTVNAAIEQLAQGKALSQESIFRKVKNLSAAGARARTVAMVITEVALLFGIVLAVFITRSITVPLAEVEKKTREISGGVFEANLNLPSPPEIGALARAFNIMCAKLKEVDRMKSDFFSLMSHELRTPLTSIKEGTNLFLEGLGGEITEKQRKLLTIIAEESNRLIELVNSLLDLSKLEAGMVTFHFSRNDLPPLIARVIREVVPLAEAKGIKIDNDIGEIPPVSVDAERILQALRNLLGNALKFTPSGGSVRVAARRSAQGVSVSVADTGPGIPKEHVKVIFDKFRQVAPAGSRTLQGSGLGLAIVKHIIHAHGGKVWVESEVGQGSTFIFALPA